MDIMKQELPLHRSQQFAVFYLVEPGPLQTTGQENSGGYHWASQGTSPNFINAGNKPVALLCQLLFLSEGGFLLIIYQPYPLLSPSVSIYPIFYYPSAQDSIALIEYYGLPGSNCLLRLTEVYLGCFVVEAEFGCCLG